MINCFNRYLALAFVVTVAVSWDTAQADEVILDDVIVDGSLCVGQDCINDEDFQFDTLRLKENNLRIGFTDTSSSAAFPTEDWVIVINESNNGGMNFFVIGQPYPLVPDPAYPMFGGGDALNCTAPDWTLPPADDTLNPGFFRSVAECYSKLLVLKDGELTISGDLNVTGNINSGGPAGDQLCPIGSVVIGVEADGTLICGDFGDDDDDDDD
jgi:hypothetical protein